MASARIASCLLTAEPGLWSRSPKASARRSRLAWMGLEINLNDVVNVCNGPSAAVRAHLVSGEALHQAYIPLAVKILSSTLALRSVVPVLLPSLFGVNEPRNLHMAPQKKHLRLPRSASNLHKTGQCVFFGSFVVEMHECVSQTQTSFPSPYVAGPLELNLRWLQLRCRLVVGLDGEGVSRPVQSGWLRGTLAFQSAMPSYSSIQLFISSSELV